MLLATRTLSHLRARSHPTHTHAPPPPNPNHPALVNRPPTNSLAGIVHEGVSGRDRQVGRRVLWVRGQRRQFLLALRDLRGPGLRLHVRRRRRERRRWRVHWPTSVCTISEPRAASHQLHCARLFYLLFSGISSLSVLTCALMLLSIGAHRCDAHRQVRPVCVHVGRVRVQRRRLGGHRDRRDGWGEGALPGVCLSAVLSRPEDRIVRGDH